MKERSLVVFTILSQMTIGTFWLLGILNGLSALNLLILTAVMLTALAASFLHLGSPICAWRAFSGWRSSWLSREVLCAASFTGLLGGLTLATWLPIGPAGAGLWLAALCGLALLISMMQVYRLRTIPVWNQWQTTASFFITTLLLGALLCGVLIGGRPWLAVCAIGLLGAQQAIGGRRGQTNRRHGLILTLRWSAAGILAIDFITSASWIAWLAVFLLALSSEVLARSLFYDMRKPRSMWRFAAHFTFSQTGG